MAKSNPLPVPARFKLVSVTVQRPKGQFRYATWPEAWAAIWSWVAFSQAVRVFEQTFRL